MNTIQVPVGQVESKSCQFGVGGWNPSTGYWRAKTRHDVTFRPLCRPFACIHPVYHLVHSSVFIVPDACAVAQ